MVRFNWAAAAGEKNLIGQPTRRVVIELRDVGDLIRVVRQTTGGIEELFDTPVGPGARADAVEQVKSLIERDTGGIDSVRQPVLVVIGAAENLSECIARKHEEALVAVAVRNAVSRIIRDVG